MASELAQSLPDSWEVRRLDEVATIIDSLHKTPSYSDVGGAMVRVTDVQGGFLDLSKTLRVIEEVFQEFTRRYAPKKGDMVISRVGSYGNVSYARTDTPFCLGQNTALISPRINGRFLHLFLQSAEARWQIEQVVVGSTQKTISLKSINALQVPIPPPDELEAIASILGALDDKIELNRRMNATLEAMARALFQSWFVDFDPVRAKLDGRKPEGMDKATAALFPEHLEDSPLGPVPQGWEVLELGDLLGKEGYVRGPFGSSLKRSDMDEEGVPVYEQQHAIYNTREFRFFVSDEKHKTLKRFTVRGNDLIISCSGTVGRISIIRPDDPEGIISQALLILRPDTAKATSEFLFYFLTSPQGLHSITSVSSGSVQVNIAKRQVIEAIKLVVPPRALISAYDEFARSVREESLRNLKELSTLSLLRDTLLPKLLSGELSVAAIPKETK